MKKNSLMIIAGIIMSGIALSGYFVHEGFNLVSIISVISFFIIITIILMVIKKHDKLQAVQKDELTIHVSLKSFRNAYFQYFF